MLNCQSLGTMQNICDIHRNLIIEINDFSI